MLILEDGAGLDDAGPLNECRNSAADEVEEHCLFATLEESHDAIPRCIPDRPQLGIPESVTGGCLALLGALEGGRFEILLGDCPVEEDLEVDRGML